MPTIYKCPGCGAAMEFDSTTQKLGCHVECRLMCVNMKRNIHRTVHRENMTKR